MAASNPTRWVPDGLTERLPHEPRALHHPGFTHCQGGCVYLRGPDGSAARALLAFAAEGGRSAVFDDAGYHRLARRWEYWGAVALLTPLAGLVLMVLKPGF